MELSISLSPEILFHIGSFPVTNSFFWSLMISIIIILATLILRFSLKIVPGKFQNIFEVLISGGYGFVRSITGSDKKAKRIFPLVMTMFIFITVANLFAYIPGQAAVSLHKDEGTVAVFRAVIADYGMVFVMTMLAVLLVQITAIAVHGPFGYIGKFINLSGFKKFFSYLIKGKIKMSIFAQGFLDLFLGLMDIVGEFAKILSLSFRLFGNIFAGEVLGAVMLFLFPFFLPLPFMILGLLGAVVQAFVFSVLTLVFITLASEIEEDEYAEAASM